MIIKYKNSNGTLTELHDNSKENVGVAAQLIGNIPTIDLSGKVDKATGKDLLLTTEAAKIHVQNTDNQLVNGAHSVNLDLAGNLHVENIVQQGSSYETHAEQISTTKDEIILRENAIAGLANGVTTGLRAKLYDGVNDGLLEFDNSGIARVGDVGSTQPISTREETPIDGGFAFWDVLTFKFKTVAINVASIMSHLVNVLNPHGVTKTQVGLSNVPNLTFSGSNTGDETVTSLSILITTSNDQGVTIPLDTDTLILDKGATFNKWTIANVVNWFATLFVSKVVGKGLSTNDYDDIEVSKVAQIKNISDSADYIGKLFISDEIGNVILKADSTGLNATKLNILDNKGMLIGAIDNNFFKTIYTDINDSNPSSSFNNYNGQYLIADENGNVIFKIDNTGVQFLNSATDQLVFQQISTGVAKISSSNKNTKVFFSDSKLAGKNLLSIGDSLTAANIWQQKTASILGMNSTTHALGGINIVQFVDGATGGNGTIAALNSTDVAGKDIIVILGPYNSRILMSTVGIKTDMYPTQSTLWGQMNYLFKRIYQELSNANNQTCKIIFSGCHAFGRYSYNDKNAYEEYPVGTGYNGEDFANKLKEICGYNSIEYIDLFHTLGINSYTWNTYQATSQPNATNYIGYINGRGSGVNDPFPDLSTLNASIVSRGFVNGDNATVTGFIGYYAYNGSIFSSVSITNYYPWVSDQLHCQILGYNLIGNKIASEINKFTNN